MNTPNIPIKVTALKTSAARNGRHSVHSVMFARGDERAHTDVTRTSAIPWQLDLIWGDKDLVAHLLAMRPSDLIYAVARAVESDSSPALEVTL